jgi:hypothetical protein
LSSIIGISAFFISLFGHGVMAEDASMIAALSYIVAALVILKDDIAYRKAYYDEKS